MGPGPYIPRVTTKEATFLPRTLLAGAASALLPDRQRCDLARRYEIDPPRWSLALGLLQMIAGTSLFLAGGLAFLRPASADQSLLLLQNWRPDLSTTHFQGLGLINWLAWFLHPLSWPFGYLALVGVARSSAFAISREAVAEPIVWLTMEMVTGIRERSSRAAKLRRLGPARPDRLLERSGDGSRLIVLSSREKTDWTPAATIEIDDRYYLVMDVTERPDGNSFVLAYRLQETHPAALVRRLVRYRPPS